MYFWLRSYRQYPQRYIISLFSVGPPQDNKTNDNNDGIFIINSIFDYQMGQKLTQEEIDALINSEDEGEVEDKYSEGFEKEVEEEYPDDNQMNQDIDEEGNQNNMIQDYPEVESEIASENVDQIMSEKMDNQSQFAFKKDQDLSEAKSEFIESSRLNDAAILKVKSNLKFPQIKKDIIDRKNIKENPKKIANKIQKPSDRSKKQSQKKIRQNNKQAVKGEKKEKVSEQEINRRLKQIQNNKKEIQLKKQEKIKKEEQIRRKQYQQAKKIEQQRKQKNRKILEQQQKSKKTATKKQSRLNIPQQELKIPQKRTDYKYLDMKKQKQQQQKKIKIQIQQQNIKKLKKLNENKPQQLKGQQKKMAILQQKKQKLQREKKTKKQQGQQQDVLIVKQIKKQIGQCKQFNLQRNKEINRAEKNIQELKQQIKAKEKILFVSGGNQTQKKEIEVHYDDITDLTTIQRFVKSIPEADTVDAIFTTIDSNGDGVLSSQQIRKTLIDMNLQAEIITQIQHILDENCDGLISRQQFVFLIELQLKKQKEYKAIMGDIDIINPLEMEAKIIDMQAKMKYLNKQLDDHLNSKKDQGYREKIQKLEKKADKLTADAKKMKEELLKQAGKKEVNVNSIANLTNQFVKLRNEKNVKLSFLQKMRAKVKQNLAEKNRLLSSRVEQNLRLAEQVFKIKNEIQQRELKYLSIKKMQQNKKGYIERQTQNRKELQEAYKRTKQYQISITDPGKKAQKSALAEEMRFLAAVIMIQRNYRKRKARGQLQRLKAENSA